MADSVNNWDRERSLQVAVCVLGTLLLWSIINRNCVKVYRFYRPTCPWCVKSQAEWDNFKSCTWFRMIKPIDVNLNEATADEKALADNFGVASVPSVLAVYPDGTRVKHEGKRTVEGYLSWLN